MDFVAEQKSLVFVRDKINYLQNLSRATMYHLNMTEHVVHFWRIVGTLEGHGTSPKSRAEPSYCCRYPSNTNVLTGILKFSFAGTVLDIEAAPGASGRRPMLRPEQKRTPLMGFIIRKFTEGCDIVLDPYKGTGATAKVCLRESRNRNSTCCDASSE